MKSIKILFIAFLTGMAAWGCSSSTSADPDDWSPGNQPYALAKMVSAASDSLIGLAQQIPGFGGVFINQADQLSIYLTEPSDQRDQAIEVFSDSEIIANVIEGLQNQGSSASVEDMEILHGQYTFIELYNWKIEVSSKILSIEDVHLIGVDQSRNKVSIGVENKAAKEKAVMELDPLNISVEAFIFYQMTPPELFPGH